MFKSYLANEKRNFLEAIIPPHQKVLSLERETINRLIIGQAKTADYITVLDLIGILPDIQETLCRIVRHARDESRIVLTSYNFVWEPIFALLEKLAFRKPQPIQNWLSLTDINNLLYLSDLEIIRDGTFLLLPIPIPFLTSFINRYLARLPLFKEFCLMQYVIARKKPQSSKDHTVSVVIPARNEVGNIESAVVRTPNMGTHTEIIFVEGNSKDNTEAEIKRVMQKYKQKDISLLHQGKGVGKGDAVRQGFAKAKGEILMILDADLTMPPEELPKFYNALKEKKGEFIMGSRLVYQMENQAMRFLNIIANKSFGIAFSYFLGQPIKDTLCGTKALLRSHYNAIAQDRSYFGDFDPFGDFDLIFGAVRQNLKIVEIPIRYHARTYGTTNINRFRHGWLLLKMTLLAALKLKFI